MTMWCMTVSNPVANDVEFSVHTIRTLFLALIGFLLPDLSLFGGEIIAQTESSFPSYTEYRLKQKPTEVILLDRDGTPIQTLRSEFGFRRVEWLEAEDFSPNLLSAIFQAEDRNFLIHEGVDTMALVSAGWAWLRGQSYRGGSTITMQVASMLDSKLGVGGRRRSVSQKFRQIQAAGLLESQWTKDEILSVYLNQVPMRGEYIGIPSMSYALYGVSPRYLNREQSLVLASLIRAPNAKPYRVARRVIQLANVMGWNLDRVMEGDMIPAINRETEHETDRENWHEHIERLLSDPSVRSWAKNLAPHYTSRFHRGERGIVHSTIEADVQLHAIQSLKKNLTLLREQNVRDGGVLVLENRTGNVIAYLGGIPSLSSAEYVDSVTAMRQAGSTLKPFLYGLAFQKKYLTESNHLADTPLEIDVERGMYRPVNYDRDYRGLVTVREALASSLNVPAVRTIQLTGIDEFHRMMGSLGFSGLKESEFYGYSLALGTADVSLWDLTSAYWQLARASFSGDLLLTDRKIVEQTLITPQVAYLVSQILSDREARSGSFGLENSLSTRFWSAVKTGTSQDMRDNWCIGFTEHYTVGVWIGNFSGEPMRNVTGISGAGPIWRDLVEFLNSRNSGRAPARPPGIVEKYGYNYLEGTEPVADPKIRQNNTFREAQDPKILYPGNGLVIAIDPDIPPGRERVLFRLTRYSQDWKWYIGKHMLAVADRDFAWQPTVGKHRLTLRNQSGKILDEVRFWVR